MVSNMIFCNGVNIRVGVRVTVLGIVTPYYSSTPATSTGKSIALTVTGQTLKLVS